MQELTKLQDVENSSAVDVKVPIEPLPTFVVVGSVVESFMRTARLSTRANVIAANNNCTTRVRTCICSPINPTYMNAMPQATD